MASELAVSREMLVKLREKGWRRCGDGWRHPRLVYSWPVWSAIRLQHETDKGKHEPIHKIMRGEVWP